MKKEQEISINEILALCVRKGKILLVTAMIIAVLAGGYQYRAQINAMANETVRVLHLESVQDLKAQDNWKETMRATLEQVYETNLADYENATRANQQRIVNYEKKRISLREYIDHSLLMRLDPYKVYVTTKYFNIADIEERAYEQPFGQGITAFDYLSSQIAQQYAAVWSGIQLQDMPGLAQYRDTANVYLRELVTLSRGGSGQLCITALGDTADISEALAEAAYSYLLSQSDEISKRLYVHSILPVSIDANFTIHQALSGTQKAVYDTLDSYDAHIKSITAELDKLEKPSNPADHLLKNILIYMILGGFVGAFLICGWAVVQSMIEGRTENAAQLEALFALPLLGALPKKRSMFDRWADNLAGEHVWKDEQQALSYVEEKAKLLCAQRKTLLLLSTEAMDAGQVAAVCKALSGDGKAVEYAGEFANNPAAIDALRRCDAVILAERLRKSKLAKIDAALSLAEKAQKPVDGFVLL